MGHPITHDILSVMQKRNDELSLPRRGDRLLRQDDGGPSAVWTSAMARRWGYVLGYKQGADRIAESVADLDTGSADLMAYPAAFLYRQYLELALKEIDLLAAGYLQDEYQPPLNHKLIPLWGRFDRAYKSTGREPTEAHLAAEQLVRDWDEIDPGSFAFRYPQDKEGQPAIPNLPIVDLETLSERMKRLDGFLYGAYTWLDETLTARYENAEG